jgi:hypothetical protein
MKSASSSLSISLATSRFINGSLRTKLRESVLAIVYNNLDASIRNDFKNRITLKITETENQIKAIGPVLRGDKKNARKLIKLTNNLSKYIGALSDLQN